MRSLLTVSEVPIRGNAEERAVQRWISETRAVNAEFGLTGGLVLSRNLLADIVEGESAAIHASLERGRKAHHHVRFTVVDTLTITESAFSDWQLLYDGCSTYVAGPIAALLDAPDAFNADRLRSLMRAFADVSAPIFDKPRGRSNVRDSQLP